MITLLHLDQPNGKLMTDWAVACNYLSWDHEGNICAITYSKQAALPSFV